jgi:hypothetical protein
MNAEKRKDIGPEQQVQYNYETVPGDSLPLIAELCGHSGEWRDIMDTAPWLWEVDWNNIQPGMTILLPPGWEIGGPVEIDTTSSTNTGSSTIEEIREVVEDFESRH